MGRNGGNMMYDTTITVSKALFPPEVVLKAAYAFLDRAYLHIEEDPLHWQIQLRCKDAAGSQSADLGAALENELLSQAVRLRVFQQTKPVRELLLARAMSSTLVDDSDPLERIREEIAAVPAEELETILTDWFEQYDR